MLLPLYVSIVIKSKLDLSPFLYILFIMFQISVNLYKNLKVLERKVVKSHWIFKMSCSAKN